MYLGNHGFRVEAVALALHFGATAHDCFVLPLSSMDTCTNGFVAVLLSHVLIIGLFGYCFIKVAEALRSLDHDIQELTYHCWDSSAPRSTTEQ